MKWKQGILAAGFAAFAIVGVSGTGTFTEAAAVQTVDAKTQLFSELDEVKDVKSGKVNYRLNADTPLGNFAATGEARFQDKGFVAETTVVGTSDGKESMRTSFTVYGREVNGVTEVYTPDEKKGWQKTIYKKNEEKGTATVVLDEKKIREVMKSMMSIDVVSDVRLLEEKGADKTYEATISGENVSKIFEQVLTAIPVKKAEEEKTREMTISVLKTMGDVKGTIQLNTAAHQVTRVASNFTEPVQRMLLKAIEMDTTDSQAERQVKQAMIMGLSLNFSIEAREQNQPQDVTIPETVLKTAKLNTSLGMEDLGGVVSSEKK